MSSVVKWFLVGWFSFFGLLHSEASPGNSHVTHVLVFCEHRVTECQVLVPFIMICCDY